MPGKLNGSTNCTKLQKLLTAQCSTTTIGKHNLDKMRSLGADHIEFTLNKNLRKKINKYQLVNIGDISWPEHVAIWTIPAKASISYNVPLLIWGENDLVTPPEVAVEFNSLLPNSELIWIKKCGHAPMMEHPKEFNRILFNWLDKKKDSI